MEKSMEREAADAYDDTTAHRRVRSRYPLVTACLDVCGREWTIETVRNQDALLDAADELDHFPYGLLLWESAVGLARRLAASPGLLLGRRVLELGAGVGLPGLVARALGADVWQTDHHPDALVLSACNAVRNGVTGVHRYLADWRSWTTRERFDIILGADILYEREMRFYLNAIFCGNLSPGGLLMLSDPGRPQALEFVAHMETDGWRVEMSTIPVLLPHGSGDDREVEVAILTCAPKAPATKLAPR